MATTTNLSTLKINYLTQSQYDTALSNNQINENEIYLTSTSSGEYKKLLWSNNSSGSFAAQTISLDLAGYDCVEVWFYTSSDSDPLLTNVITLEVGQKNRAAIIHSLGAAGTNENTGSRQVVINSNGVVFSDYTYKNRRSGGTLTTANEFAIPYKIYGIKYERVTPIQVDASDYVIEQGTASTTHSTSGTTIWTYRKWNSGIAECWGTVNVPSATYAANGGYKSFGFNFPTELFNVAPTCLTIAGGLSSVVQTDVGFTHIDSNVSGQSYLVNRNSSSVTVGGWAYVHVMGTWK